ncbi:hypothetical protein SPBR_06553 [Sporothrix brasiliensis 5110]|uniref:Dimethylaniline monooxygenase n=1 Tax=Sporothrix brasiliensis 5110 TaxID=1398154 RepID=A0A0C2EPH2_9PEZI|nr:uncharacterized protein SPBR_06553 [Sporothrix brasiliensis 5110]KIH88119.1 hypothetical protein SPBR_06553 [Sporothrix brasiliensis 5110]
MHDPLESQPSSQQEHPQASEPPRPPQPRCRRVAVIGAGPAGAIATDALVKEQAFDVVRVFERKTQLGGTWVYDPASLATPRPAIPSVRALLNGTADRPVDVPTALSLTAAGSPVETEHSDAVNAPSRRYAETGVHDGLHSNLPPQTMSFTQEPIPAVVSEHARAQYGAHAPFRHREVIRRWVEGIFAAGDHRPLVSLGTYVERAEKRGAEWVLTLRAETVPSNKRSTSKPKPVEAVNTWWHETFDAVVVASGHYSLPYLPPIAGLAEYDEAFPGRIRHSKHFRNADDFAHKRVIVVGGSVSAFDALHAIRRVAQHPVVASLRQPLAAFGWPAFTHRHVDIRPPIVQFHADTGRIDFADGSSVQEVDVVLFATGYDFSFTFLAEAGGAAVDVAVKNRRIQGLYQHVFCRADPCLAFVGMVAGGLTFRVFEWQAVAAARVFAGRAVLPSHEEMRQWEADTVAARGDGVRFFNVAPDFADYFDGLRRLAGDPAPGTTGRVLPPFQQQWADAFNDVVALRLAWWERERRKAEAAMATTATKASQWLSAGFRRAAGVHRLDILGNLVAVLIQRLELRWINGNDGEAKLLEGGRKRRCPGQDAKQLDGGRQPRALVAAPGSNGAAAEDGRWVGSWLAVGVKSSADGQRRAKALGKDDVGVQQLGGGHVEDDGRWCRRPAGCVRGKRTRKADAKRIRAVDTRGAPMRRDPGRRAGRHERHQILGGGHLGIVRQHARGPRVVGRDDGDAVLLGLGNGQFRRALADEVAKRVLAVDVGEDGRVLGHLARLDDDRVRPIRVLCRRAAVQPLAHGQDARKSGAGVASQLAVDEMCRDRVGGGRAVACVDEHGVCQAGGFVDGELHGVN